MDIEQIALIDLYLKSIPKFGLQNIINIDKLIVLSSSKKDILGLKNAANNLTNVKSYIKPADLPMWETFLKEQIRFSIDRAKMLKNNG